MFFCHAPGVPAQDLFGVFFRRLEKAGARVAYSRCWKMLLVD
jgi:hypothetical protein